MDRITFKNIRVAYYLGIFALVLNALPQAKIFLSPFFNIKLLGGFTILEVIALLTAVGAIMAYQRKL